MTLEFLEERLKSFGLPGDLSGNRVLDIGPWDGFFSFEMERRGAQVSAIDYVDLDTFRAIRQLFRSRVTYERKDVYELHPERDGAFDIVLCLGVLYHLKHPLLALERICAVTSDRCIIETFVADGEDWLSGHSSSIPFLEFYERDELAGQLDNWCGPNVAAVCALIRSAGFARAEILRVSPSNATIAAHRRWPDIPSASGPAIQLRGINCHSHRGRSFRSEKEEYLALWCDWPDLEPPLLDAVFPEVDGFGVAPLSCIIDSNSLHVSVRVPPGLAPGRHGVRLRAGEFDWSRVESFFVDLPDSAIAPKIISAQDGISWSSVGLNGKAGAG